MKKILTFAILATCWIWVMCSCATTTVRVITTDKEGRVTETTTTTKASDAGALAFAGQIATAYAPRGIIIREEKAAPPSDLRRILKTRPITKEEIANRWKPAPNSGAAIGQCPELHSNNFRK